MALMTPIGAQPMELDAQTIELARATLPPLAGEHNEGNRNLLETAIASLVALQMSVGASAMQLCKQPDGDEELDALSLVMCNHVRLFRHFVDAYRGLRDKPEVVN